jgi:hypothetical protein
MSSRTFFSYLITINYNIESMGATEEFCQLSQHKKHSFTQHILFQMHSHAIRFSNTVAEAFKTSNHM